jgi:hypothetical protein
MSRANIVGMAPLASGELQVTFRTKNGDMVTYIYDEISGIQIMAGADPKDYQGEKIS